MLLLLTLCHAHVVHGIRSLSKVLDALLALRTKQARMACIAVQVGDDEMMVIGGHFQAHSDPEEVKLGATNLLMADHYCTWQDVEQFKELSTATLL
jgi:hypothetical protein